MQQLTTANQMGGTLIKGTRKYSEQTSKKALQRMKSESERETETKHKTNEL